MALRARGARVQAEASPWPEAGGEDVVEPGPVLSKWTLLGKVRGRSIRIRAVNGEGPYLDYHSALIYS